MIQRIVSRFLAIAVVATAVCAQIAPVVQESGRLRVSADAVGTTASSGFVQVDKPASGIVRSAYLAACNHRVFGVNLIQNGDVSIGGVPVTWDRAVFNNAGASPAFFHNVFADVTAVVKPLVDAAPAGLIDIPVSETHSRDINGVILTVLFDDPSAPNSSIILLFGGQSTGGDQFVINLAQPIDPAAPDARATMGLGIGHGFQGAFGTPMVSEITVNGTRLTSSAGGEDDGASADGALITVGGIGDDSANPVNPLGPSTGLRTDDELYNLLPYLSPTTTVITVDTLNPTDDDNIFFGYFVTSVPSAIGESILLSPVTAQVEIGVSHTLTARVVDSSGNAVVGRQVQFNVTSGPNTGFSSTDLTDGGGEASLSYTSTVLGLDVVVASMTNSGGSSQISNTADVDWVCTPASFSNYGAGHPGTLGVPSLTLGGLPIVGSTVEVVVGNSAASATLACILFGDAAVSIPTPIGATLLVQARGEVPYPLGIGETRVPFYLDPSFCGMSLYLQVGELDLGASNGFSATPGLLMTVGR